MLGVSARHSRWDLQGPGGENAPPGASLFAALGLLQLMWGDRGARGLPRSLGSAGDICRQRGWAAGGSRRNAACWRGFLPRAAINAARSVRQPGRAGTFSDRAAGSSPRCGRPRNPHAQGCGSTPLAVAVPVPPAAPHGMQVSELWSHRFVASQPSCWLWTSSFHKDERCLVADGLMPSGRRNVPG